MAISISFICPTFNRSKLLRRSVDSICSGMASPFEVIIADDGSSDDTRSVCQKLQKAYGAARVVVSRSEENLGAQAARNRGLRLAAGGLVMFVDSDDIAVPGGIEELIKWLEANPKLDYAHAKVIQTDAQLKPLAGDPVVGAPFTASPVDVAGYHWHTMGAVYRRSYLEKVGPWNPALTGSQDWEYQARVKLAGGQGQFVDAVVGYWRHHGGSRVGANAFRPDYVRSVMLACDSILQHARRAGCCDRALERRLAKKLIVHALEWGCNGRRKERQQCLLQAGRTVSNDLIFKVVTRCFQISPRFVESWLWKLLTSHKSKAATSESKSTQADGGW